MILLKFNQSTTQFASTSFFCLCQILVHLGLLTKESGFKIAENAFSGGPLGELVQWSDLITTLYLLGHDVRISASIAELKESVPNTLSNIIHLKYIFRYLLLLLSWPGQAGNQIIQNFPRYNCLWCFKVDSSVSVNMTV